MCVLTEAKPSVWWFFYGLWTQDQCICNMSDVKNMLHMVREKGGREREREGGGGRDVSD